MTAAPTHTIMKTISKRRVLSSALVPELKTLIYEFIDYLNLHSEHKAEYKRSPEVPYSESLSSHTHLQFLISLVFAVEARDLKGKITTMSFYQILPRSLFYIFDQRQTIYVHYGVTYNCFTNWLF